MILPDANVLIFAFRTDSVRHDEYKAWLQAVVEGPIAYGMAPQVLASLMRITTNRRVYARPSTPAEVFDFCDYLLEPPTASVVQPGPRHWGIYRDLCMTSGVIANLTQDAWFAALAIEHGCEWLTDDRDYSTFPGLRWRHPLD